MPPPAQNPSTAKPTHARNPSNAGGTKSEAKPTVKRTTTPSSTTKPEIHFTALIRLPFPRGSFVDPPQVDWDGSKDKALWKIISRLPKAGDLDWEELASKFQVPHTFMLQQAAWLYERHLSHVRAQMRRVGGTNPSTGIAPSGTPIPVGGYAMKRLGSGGGSRAPSSLSMRSPKPESSVPGTPRAPPLSRSPSTNTVTQSRPLITPASPRQPLQHSFRSKYPMRKASNEPVRPASPSSPSAADEMSSGSSSSSEDIESNPIRRSQIFKRPPRFKQHKPSLARLDQSAREDDEDAADSSENDDSNTFLPFANTFGGGGRSHDPTATLRQPPVQQDVPTSPDPSDTTSYTSGPDTPGKGGSKTASRTRPGKEIVPADSSASSASSAAPTGVFSNTRPHTGGTGGHRHHRTGISASGRSPGGPMSPRHRAELARLNPHKRGISFTSVSSVGSAAGPSSQGGPSSGKGKESEKSDGGTPSMGSSFSDLDDPSLTQSALEEALLSNMQHGRMSTLSSLRSRYL